MVDSRFFVLSFVLLSLLATAVSASFLVPWDYRAPVGKVLLIGNDVLAEVSHLVDSISLRLTGRVVFFADLPVCTDSDGGINANVRGTTTGSYAGYFLNNGNGIIIGEDPNKFSQRIDSSLNYSIIYDYCHDSSLYNQLDEAYCDSNGKMSSYGYACQYGCRDGVCLVCASNGTTCNPSNNQQVCTGGQWTNCPSGQICQNNACVASQCSGTQCNPSNSSQYCYNGQWAGCYAGQICSNGACVQTAPAPVACTLNDWQCNPNNNTQYCLTSVWFNCPSGKICNNGACIAASASNNTNNSVVSQPPQNVPSSQPTGSPVSQLPSQLPVQLTCVQNTCNPSNSRVVCSSGQWVDCPGNATCSSGVCVIVNQSSTPGQNRRNNNSTTESENAATGSSGAGGTETRGNTIGGRNESTEILGRNGLRLCDGCSFGQRCVPLGYRVNLTYCALNGTFDLQKSEGEACENHFECNSNLCAANKCVSGDLIGQIINWFKQLFRFS